MDTVTLIVDADDTLWENNIYYDQCIANFVALMAGLGFDREEADHTVHAVERERVPVVGYAPEEFVNSLVVAYERLCERRGQAPEDGTVERVREIGQAVIGYPIVLLDGVAGTLARLKERFRLILLTKGDPATQEDKLTRSGLAHFFDGVHVVAEKDAAVFRNLIAQYALSPAQTWMVGNSPRSDINPAVAAGLGAVYVPHSETWGFELGTLVESERVTVVERFADLVPLFLGGVDGAGEMAL
ncbi:MAG TPA: HAD family hydrolase [Chloroflexi bacterium]|nr:HAD family hydrolase [Chloroflexota bacterium]